MAETISPLIGAIGPVSIRLSLRLLTRSDPLRIGALRVLVYAHAVYMRISCEQNGLTGEESWASRKTSRAGLITA